MARKKGHRTSLTALVDHPKIHKAHQHLRHHHHRRDNEKQAKVGHSGIYSISVIEVVGILGMQDHPDRKVEQVEIRGLEEGQMKCLRKKTLISMIFLVKEAFD